MLLINKKPTEQKPVASLKENLSGFKFQAPQTATVAETTVAAVVEEPVATKPVKPNGNGLLIPTAKVEVPVATQSKKPSSLIPEMADDKYEVVAGSAPEFTEEAGNKFSQQLEMLQSAIDGNGELKDQMTNILTFLDDNPQYKENISPKDVAIFVAGCRKVAGITVTEKIERKSKKTKTSADVEDVLADLADLSFDL